MATPRRNASEEVKNRIENHPVVVYLSIAVVAFVAGFGAAWWLATNVLVPSKDEQIRQLNAELTSVQNALTKRGDISSARLASTLLTNSADIGLRPAISVQILANVVATNSVGVLTELRKARGLRELTALESGKRSSTVPNGTYFFCSAYRLEDSPFRGPNDYVVNRFKPHDHAYFEVHRLEGGRDLVVGFTSSSEGAAVSYLEGDKDKSLILFPEAIKDQNTLVSIPIDRVVSCVARDLEFDAGGRISVLDIGVK